MACAPECTPSEHLLCSSTGAVVNHRLLATCCAAFFALLHAGGAQAHGIWGHVHVTGWAIENLPEGELRDFFDDPEVFNAALYGAAFTDSGYWPQGDGDFPQRARAYGEHTHWEPFVESYITWMQQNDPAPYSSQESRLRVAFLMGCAAHGFQDEFFDSVFLFHTNEKDEGRGQEEADSGTDGFLAVDEHLRFVPEPYYPTELLLELYAEVDPDISAADIDQANRLMQTVYVNESIGYGVAASFAASAEEEIPWSRANYLNPTIPGSLRAEILPTGRYLQALWDRLHGRFDSEEPVIFRFPEEGTRLLGTTGGSPDSWVTLIFGIGLQNNTAQAELIDELQHGVDFEQQDTRYTGAGYSRLLRVQPINDLDPGAYYDFELVGGTMIDGQELSEGAYSFTFQTKCLESQSGDCPELDPPVVASIEPPNPPYPTPVEEPPTEDPGDDDPAEEEPPANAGNSGSAGGCTQTPGAAGHLPLAFICLIVLHVRRRTAQLA